MSILQPVTAAPIRTASDRAQMRDQLTMHLEVALSLADELNMGFVAIDVCQALARMETGYNETN